ncbi:hypothetical protein AB4076_13310 [Dyella sp. 2RAF44]|uniref:hypothetical protein n=1 Tax=Dyella sp. 2RAF44 TaxID=3233000 RepID=UPI003F8EFD82
MPLRVKTILGSVFIAGTMLVANAHAQTSSGIGTVLQINTGWAEETFMLAMSTPVINPAGCPTADTYESTASQPGYKTYLATALTALASGSRVAAVVSNSVCTGGRPTLIGLSALSN